MHRVIIVQDLQFGSTGKGQIAGSFAHSIARPDTVVTAWGPNAGHTFRSGAFKMVTTMLATSSIAPSVHNILIGPGAVVKMSSLRDEILAVKELLAGKRLIIHPQAMLWREEYAEHEAKNLLRVGSTMKGTGEALVAKVRRDPFATVGSVSTAIDMLAEAALEAKLHVCIDSKAYDKAIDDSQDMVVEGAQGFSLGLHTDFYPHCTSRDVSTAQLLADCRIPIPRDNNDLYVIGVCRTYPIRVANRLDDQGNLVGTSGSYYSDQREIKWSDLGREPELTTVTKLPRRLFTFSHQQISEAIRIMRPDALALTFCDYLEPADHAEGEGIRVVAPNAVRDLVSAIEFVSESTEKGAHFARVEFFSFGPTMEDVYVRHAEYSYTGEITQLKALGKGAL